ncbi:immunity 53 family protein [Halalkalibacter sp. APA_J-10(15)]|uniref:immunity 53 family protein n=1 Tax=Halalkalibacter sp. APA_J-10(15) TaxID=2933805 RepID=UPI001FF2E77D|nr:immunity 53 family protein [Halalkalibacter sp. APA_J-10(15)]MCK0473240.1 immunity 53 family protein [Halalkalibacter sp. APA_J-10(15)]
MGTLNWVERWYSSQCNGDWEHEFGVRIETLDNPGWSVTISIENTDLRYKSFETVNIERDTNNWLHCKIDYHKERDGYHFFGYGGSGNLEEILNTFKEWAES